MDKLIKIGEEQIEKLVKLQDEIEYEEDKLKISRDINDWVKTIKDCKMVETSKEFIDKFGEVINPLMEMLKL